jgi:hypothetical protein
VKLFQAAGALGLALISSPFVLASGVDDEPWQEQAMRLPDVPSAPDLIEFSGGPSNPNRFFIDGKNLRSDPDGVVRYTLVIRTPSGIESVTHEGIRCKTYERRLYAISRPGGGWSVVHESRWQRILSTDYNRHHAVLARSSFCDLVVPYTDLAQMRESLKNTLKF